jgi:glutamyl-tRNA reductase
VAADVAKIENVYLYNMDDLQQAVMATRSQRSAAVEAAGEIVQREVREFVAWNRARMMGPLIDQLYQKSHAVAREELERIVGKLSNVSAQDQRQLEDLTRRIVNKLLHDPVQALRESDSDHAPMSQYLHAVQQLFRLNLENLVPGNAAMDGSADGATGAKRGSPGDAVGDSAVDAAGDGADGDASANEA